MSRKTRASVSSVADVVGFGVTADHKRVEVVGVDILVDEHADRALAGAVRDAFLPEQGTAHVSVALLGSVPSSPVSAPDLAIIIGGGSDEAVRAAASTYARMSVPVAVLATSALDAPVPTDEAAIRYVKAIVATEPAVVIEQLAEWAVSATKKATALAASFPFCRRARVSELTGKCSAQNATVGIMSALGRGGKNADFVVMTANQAKLALDISAAYGRELSPQRAFELATVVLTGLGCRALARTAAHTLPNLGMVVNAGIAYGGTTVMAMGIADHYERQDAGEAPFPLVRGLFSTVADGISSASSAIAQRSARRTVASDGMIIPVNASDLQAGA